MTFGKFIERCFFLIMLTHIKITNFLVSQKPVPKIIHFLFSHRAHHSWVGFGGGRLYMWKGLDWGSRWMPFQAPRAFSARGGEFVDYPHQKPLPNFRPCTTDFFLCIQTIKPIKPSNHFKPLKSFCTICGTGSQLELQIKLNSEQTNS